MHRTSGRRAATLLVLAAGAAPARFVARGWPGDCFAFRHAMDGIGSSRLLGILLVLCRPSHEIFDNDRRDRSDRHALTAHPFDASVEAGAVVAVRYVGPVLGEARPATDCLFVLA